MSNEMTKLLAITLVVGILANGCSPARPASNNTPPTTNTPKPAAPVGINVGNQAIDFQLRSLNGTTVRLSELRGKPVLLNFWATWCGPCRSEMPYLQQINDTWTAKGLVMLEVDIGENSAIVQNFMTSLNLTLPVLLDSAQTVAGDYSVAAIPTTYFIDKNGIIRGKNVGAFPNKATIESELSKIIP